MVAQALGHELFELLATGLGDALALLLLAARPPRALVPSRQLLRGPAHSGVVQDTSTSRGSPCLLPVECKLCALLAITCAQYPMNGSSVP